jgi:hypothetical protein
MQRQGSVSAKYVNEIPNVKLFITGRPEDHIGPGFAIPSLRAKESSLHDMESSAVADIKSFVKSGLEEVATRNCLCITGPWPSEEDISLITTKASGLFIVASVVVGFVDDFHAMPRDRLKLIISRLSSTVYEGMSDIDATYEQVLVARFSYVDKGDSEFLGQLRLVMASIVLAFHPLSRASLVDILRMSPERVWMILRSLHSVLIVPESASQPIRICHKSFADFLANPQRCFDERFHINVPTHDSQQGIFCLELMNTTLTRNIRRLPRYAVNKDIEDLHARRDKYTEPSLAYACGYWAKHLQMSTSTRASNGTKIIVERVNQFFRHNHLSWLEVGNFGATIYSLHSARLWLRDTREL